MTHALFMTFPALMVFAASYDAVSMTISNRLCLLVAAAFFPVAASAGLGLLDMALNLSCAAAMLAAGFALFAAGWIGGGDAKLFAAAALWFGWSGIAEYALAVAVFGGVLSLAVLLIVRASLHVPFAALWLPERPELPYGVALAAGALAAYPHLTWMATLAG
jgi:prepilin peptidase CpaA